SRVRHLLAQGANPNARKRVTLTATIKTGLFSSQTRSEARSDTADCEPALVLAIFRGAVGIVDALLTHGAGPNGQPEWRIASGWNVWTLDTWSTRWYSTSSFPSPAALAVGKGGMWKGYDGSTGDLPDAETSRVWVNLEGGHVRMHNPVRRADRRVSFTLRPSLPILNLLLLHGAVVSDAELTAARRQPDTRFLEVLVRYQALQSLPVVPPAVELSRGVVEIPSSTERPIWQIDYRTVVRGAEIGRGDFGVVYKCKWAAVEVAGKYLEVDKSLPQEALRKAFMSEVAAWYTAGNHPNILPLLGASWEGPSPLMLSKFMKNGKTLDYLVRSPARATAPTKLRMLSDIAAGMMYLHNIRDIVHADLKPENALVDDYGTTQIGDFGTSKLNSSSFHTTATGNRMGTGLYMPPERLTGGGATKQGDVYAFGITAFRIWTQRKPYTELSLPESAIYFMIVNDNMRPTIEAADEMPLELQN
ncbi:hypothetical protein HDU93_003162, partial [Gonapodya sp. JEL0774]